MARDKNDSLTSVKVISLEVTGDYGDAGKTWYAIAKDCRDLANAYWQCWNSWHYRNNSYQKLKDWYKKRETEGEDAGKCPVKPVPPELAKELHQLRWRFPRIPSKVSTLLPRRIEKTMLTRKATKGSLPGYAAIILGEEGFPRYNRPFPILFDSVNAVFEPPATREDNWAIHIKLERMDGEDGKGKEVMHRLELRCKGKKVQSQVQLLKRVAEGVTATRDALAAVDAEYGPRLNGLDKKDPLRKEWQLKRAAARLVVQQTHCVFGGSQLVYSSSLRKWFVRICFTFPEKPATAMNKENVAVLRAGETGPWELTLPDGSIRHPGGWGHHVGRNRRRLAMERADRKAHYRHASDAARGHGRKRATGPEGKLRNHWQKLVQSCNWHVAEQVIKACRANDCGTLIYEQPAGEFKDSRFLTTSGQSFKDCYYCDDGVWHGKPRADGSREEKPCKYCKGTGKVVKNDGTSWAYYQLTTMLNRKCPRAGIDFTAVKIETVDGDKDAGSSRKDASRATKPRSGKDRKRKSDK